MILEDCLDQSDMYFLDLNFRCPAPGCKEAFRHKGHLKSHTASFHPEVVIYDIYDIYDILPWNRPCQLHFYDYLQILGHGRTRGTKI